MYNNTLEKTLQYSGLDATGGKDLLKLTAFKDIGSSISSLMSLNAGRIATDFADTLRVREDFGGMSFMYVEAKAEAIKARAERMKHCADMVVFGRPAGDAGFKLAYANFCRDRLCPACQWRRALKTGGQMREIMEALEEEGFLFLSITYTMENCKTESLGEAVDLLQRAHRRLMRRKRFAFIKGSYRGIEITRNHDVSSPSYLTWHPHIHTVWCVRKSYFNSRNYVSLDLLKEEWNDCLEKEGYAGKDVTQIKMSKIRARIEDEEGIAKAAAEVCKYTVKARDILTGNAEIDAESLSALMRFAHGRRFISLTGNIKEMHKRLHLEDIEDPKTLEDFRGTEADIYVGYRWQTGISTYVGSWNAIQEMLFQRENARFSAARKNGASVDELEEIQISGGKRIDEERKKYFSMAGER